MPAAAPLPIDVFALRASEEAFACVRRMPADAIADPSSYALGWWKRTVDVQPSLADYKPHFDGGIAAAITLRKAGLLS